MNPILTLLIAVSLWVSSIGPASIAPGSLMTAPKPDVDKAASGKTEQLTLDTSLQPQKVVDEKPAMQEEPEEPQISPYQIVLSVNLLETSSEKIANLTWQVDGWQADAGLSLALTFPDTLHLTEKSPLQPGAEPGTWNMLLTSAEGSIDLRVNSNIKLPLEIRGELLVHDKIIDTYITLLEGALNRDSLPRIGTAGGRVSGIDGRVSVVFPSGALAEEAGIQIQRIPPQASGWVIGNGSAFEILADGRTSRKAIHRFAKSFIIQVDYDPELVEGDERSLVLTSFDEASQEWLPLPSWVDEENHILYARSNHLSVFNPSVHTMELAHLPQMKNYAISQFTGAATYSFPLQLPPGPGGLQPELSLSYNSQAVDIATGVTQASWVGMGWSLETGAIVRNMNGTSDYLPDDTFTMMVGTFSSQLVPGLDGKYHTEEESFWRIQKNGDDTWTAWDKTGMVYSFGIAYPSNAYTDLYYDMVEKFPTKTESRLRYETYDWENCDNAGQVTWAWPLVKVQNPF